ncbi:MULTISPECIES: hypothetical protein [unclassified Nodularia (in: cyanobacteria)]|uniref:hypothetical protein n=1 Tax=unclassified Nodularia (in: cyanobacteria) TaxID=2656917 RepID=UPI0018804165|nr:MULTISPECIES: hypothetical protein [unclassified Nodularia (in: cyanobacteria)]MBE9198305.1 hypothetical protein [Nodularia sp. LEGE 06071]MCC2693089.1 hypothetical protein [Nodularia sp. LEGE 04288]
MQILEVWWRLESKRQIFWQKLVNALSASSELQVWQKSDRSGHITWRAYNPMTGRSACFGSEEEMRVWIEMQYYQEM